MPLVYATPDDLTGTLGEAAPANADILLTRASALVRRVTRTWLYDTTSTGAPADIEVAEAFRDATTEQAAAWVRLGIDPASGPAAVPGAPQSTSIGSATVNYGQRPGADQDRVATLTELVPAAQDALLDVSHLVTTGVWY